LSPTRGVGGGDPAASLLLSAAGRELLDRLAGEDLDADRALALSASLRREYPAELVAAALTQQTLRVSAREKFSRANQMLFTRVGLEQASSELTARHAAARFVGSRVVADLCCGIGGNLVALAEVAHTSASAVSAGDSVIAESSQQLARREFRDHGSRVIGVDSDPTSLEFARHNVAVCAPAARANFVCADVTQAPLRGVEAVFIDPARRDDRGRLPAGQYRPPLRYCLRLAETVGRVGIKAAPGLRRELVPDGWETEFVAVGRELKEALLWSPGLAKGGGAATRATVLPAGDTLAANSAGVSARQTPAAAPSASSGLPARLAPPGAFLLDPNPAVTRAGLVTDLAKLTRTWQIDPMIAFLSSDEPVRTPFARTLRVIHSAPWHEKRFARMLRELGIGSADIRRRGLAGDVTRINRRLNLHGPGSATIVLTRVANKPWGLICEPLAD
jgi:hypothetical protein